MLGVVEHRDEHVEVLDNAKHWWIDREEIEKLLAKGEGWLADHPAR
ncbi:MAG: hypothetical protein AAGE83_14370, partial [Pseudomonadota bacterium]